MAAPKTNHPADVPEASNGPDEPADDKTPANTPTDTSGDRPAGPSARELELAAELQDLKAQLDARSADRPVDDSSSDAELRAIDDKAAADRAEAQRRHSSAGIKPGQLVTIAADEDDEPRLGVVVAIERGDHGEIALVADLPPSTRRFTADLSPVS